MAASVIEAKGVVWETGEEVVVNLSEDEVRRLANELRSGPNRRELQRQIDNLSLSADAKAQVSSIAAVTTKIGEFVLQVGRKIVEILLEVMRLIPNTTLGIAAALVVFLLASTIPVLGVVLGPLLGVITLFFGLKDGLVKDLGGHQLHRKISEMIRPFDTLKGTA